MEYHEALNEWASRKLAPGAKVLDVQLDYTEGYRYSSWTFEDPSFDIEISYELDGEHKTYRDHGQDASYTMGDLLHELLRIAGEKS